MTMQGNLMSLSLLVSQSLSLILSHQSLYTPDPQFLIHSCSSLLSNLAHFLLPPKEQERQCERYDHHDPPAAIPLFHLHVRDLRYVARYFQSVLF